MRGLQGWMPLVFFSLTQPVITTFCLYVWLVQAHTFTFVVHRVILFQSQLPSPCPVIGLTRMPQNLGNTMELKPVPHLRHGRGRCAADEVCNTACPLWPAVSKVLLFSHLFFGNLPNFVYFEKSVTRKVRNVKRRERQRNFIEAHKAIWLLECCSNMTGLSSSTTTTCSHPLSGPTDLLF